MSKQILRAAVALLMACVLAFPQLPVADACGPYLAEAIFTDMKGPDFDYGEYVRGKLGIVQPSYYDVFLFVAYRNLSGAPFTKDESSALNPAVNTDAAIATSRQERNASGPNQTDEITLWHKAAGDSDWPGKQFPDTQGVVHSESRDGNYVEYYNCLPDAFKTARERLEQHRNQFGAESPAVLGWLEAQRKVFANCGQPYQFNKPRQESVIPVVAVESDPPVIRADRQYQTAAAHFYAGDFEDAANEFAEIAKEHESPWHEIAGYLQARALIRKGTLGDFKGNVDLSALSQAEKLLQKVVADPKQAKIKAAAQRRLDFLAARLRPDDRRIELSAKLVRPGGSANFDQDKNDYFWLLDRRGLTLGAKDELTNWISAMKQKTPEATQEAIKQWQKTKSLPWLLAAICKVEPTHPEVGELLEAASKIPANSSAHITLLFHSLRLRARLEKDSAKVVADLNTVFNGEVPQMPNSAKNQFLALRMSLARNFDEFLLYASRTPSGIAYTYGMDDDGSLMSPIVSKNHQSVRFDSDAATIFSERLPLNLLGGAAKNENLPPESQRALVLAVWTRAILLKNDPIALALAPRVVQLAPELKPAFESYLAAKTPEDRAFAATYVILRSPGLRPYVEASAGRMTPTGELDNFRDNWWCSFTTKPDASSQLNPTPRFGWRMMPSSLRQIYPDGKIPELKFLSEQDSKAAAAEFNTLTSLPSGPEWLGAETIAFAKAHVEDSRIPEALSLVVRATRLGCSTENTGKVSKAAFDLLHKKYPDDPWAKKTPYWYQ
jgi:hypothetical protein